MNWSQIGVGIGIGVAMVLALSFGFHSGLLPDPAPPGQCIIGLP